MANLLTKNGTALIINGYWAVPSETTPPVVYTDEQYFRFTPPTNTIDGYRPAGGANIVVPPTIGGIPVTTISYEGLSPVASLGVPVTIVLPEGIVTLGSMAVYAVFDGVTMNFPSTLRTIENDAFTLTQFPAGVALNNGLLSIGSGAFTNSNLTSIVIPSTVTSISTDAFVGNDLTSITIGSGLTFTDSAFGNYGTAFKTLYDGNGKQAGTYTYSGGTWTKTA